MKRYPINYSSRNNNYPNPKQESDFDQLEAMELYCRNCSRAVPVRKYLLLVLPQGEKYEYRCQFCGQTVGDKLDHSGQFYGILKT